MKKLLLVTFAALVTQSAFAFNLILPNQVMTMNDPVFDRVAVDGILDGNGLQVNYHVLDFYVTADGTYDLEMAVRSENDERDTFLLLYDYNLDPNDATLNFLAGDDDNAGTLTVLLGDYHLGSDGRSRIAGFNLLANHQYQAVMTTFDFSVTFFQTMTYDLGIGNGAGNVMLGSPVPEPTTLLVLGSGAMVSMLRKRRKK